MIPSRALVAGLLFASVACGSGAAPDASDASTPVDGAIDGTDDATRDASNPTGDSLADVSSDAPADGLDATPTVVPLLLADYCVLVAAAFCDETLACFHTLGGAPRKACVERQFDSCLRLTALDYEPFLRDGRMKYDAAKAADCYAPPYDDACSTNSFRRPACAQIFTGTLANGAPCTSALQCAGGVCTVSTSGGGPCPGACASTRKAGESCGDSGQVCDDGLFCFGDTHVCGSTKPGDPCGVRRCSAGQVCNVTAPGATSQTCQVPKPKGATCASDLECADLACIAGLCGGTGSDCTSSATCPAGQLCYLPGASPGRYKCGAPIAERGACDLSHSVDCGDGLHCEGAAADGGTTTAGTCRVPAGSDVGGECGASPCKDGLTCTYNSCQRVSALGGPCVPKFYNAFDCPVGAYCSDAGVCRAHKNSGEDCSDSAFACVPTAWCGSSKTCVARKAWGSACGVDAECLSGFCKAGACTGTCTETGVGTE